MLQSEGGYIDARRLTAISTKTLATYGRTIHSGQSLPIDDDRPTSASTPTPDVSLHCHEPLLRANSGSSLE